jgi:pyruvate dehydrogenase (quinone)
MPTDLKIAQVDIRGERLGRRSRLNLGIWGDVKETINMLHPRLGAKEDTSHVDAATKTHLNVMERLHAYVDHPGQRGAIRPEFLTFVLNQMAGPDAIRSKLPRPISTR